MDWRYIATRLNGDGTETPLSFDVPLQGAALVEDLSGPGGISGTITPEIERLKAADGSPLFLPWSTALYAEKDGRIRAGAILANVTENGPSLALDCVGFSGYLQGQPYTADLSKVQVDPLDMARHLWAHKQGRTAGDLGLVLQGTKSPVRIGTESVENNFTTGSGEQVSFESGPYTLSWWKTHDMGREFDDLAATTPFDYQVVHAWDGESISHTMRLGYPSLGGRRTDLRFMVGENVFTTPTVDYRGDDYASEVIVLGAGEGRKMVRGTSPRAAGRLHRAAVVQDKTLTSKANATKAAELELRARLGDEDISEIVALDHAHARIGSYQIGDQILIQSRQGWTKDLELWVRILAIKTEPEKNRSALTVARVEKTE